MNAFTKSKIYIVANKLPLMTRNIKISIGKQYLDDILIVSDSHRLIYTTGQSLNIMKSSRRLYYHLKHLVDYQFVSL